MALRTGYLSPDRPKGCLARLAPALAQANFVSRNALAGQPDFGLETPNTAARIASGRVLTEVIHRVCFVQV
jgi:hypothetical protein